MTRHILLLALSAVMAGLLAACTPPVTRPMGTVRFSLPDVNRQQTLLVFLPGIRDKSAVFDREGFVSAARASGIQADMLGVDAHIGYYLEKQFIARLKEDVIEPAKLQGYRNIWLVGISLGGFGALWYDIENPGDLAGIVALSPYLGEQEVVDEVSHAGGLAAWRPAACGALDDQHMIWRELKDYEQQDKNRKRVYLGYGLRDKFAIADGLLAAVLPQEQVFTIEGGHDWATWQTLWNEILKSHAFRQSN